ncbi:peptidase MA family metallohydrolase [Candidatus Oscillochloris fontis]|uniref:peptidase MA family metallohydrolase n=1 Tax=Candidatus Oscillochloris fontis TaxID=2496868 RepID=UPI00101DA45E|nr:hypothetical protein [Candidatus Oscillochloris fontis]
MILRRFCWLLLLIVLCIPHPVAAQTEWRERMTRAFSILYVAGEEAEAERYAGFVDTIYDDMSSIFAYRAPPPLSLRLYPTSAEYERVNPAARSVPGIVAHADFRRRELVVIVERTRQQSEEQVRNNVRHELTHIIAADLSEGRLNVGFQEGIAQYLERPTAELAAKVATLQMAEDQGRLLPWRSFDDREVIYGDPQISYPQTLAVVAFLVDRDGLAHLRQFLSLSAQSSGYRSALERAYGMAASDLEAEWRAWLPSYFAGGYRLSALDRYDLSLARELVAQGNYAAAQSELDRATEWIARQRETQPEEVIREAAHLKQHAEEGLRATQLAEEARNAIGSGEYERGLERIEQARRIFALLGDTHQDAVLASYSQRAQRGMAASIQLSQASELVRRFQLSQARSLLDLAAQEFATLGNQSQLTTALALRQDLDVRQRIAGIVLLTLGVLGVLGSLVGRFFQRPDEVW